MIGEYSQYSLTELDYALRHDDHAEINELLMGHSVRKVTDDHLELDDGTLLKIVPNEGGCACSAGDYDLTHLEGSPNVITSVEHVVDDVERPSGYGSYTRYRVYVVAFEDRINLWSVDGDDGNGYYGTGYMIFVRPPMER